MAHTASKGGLAPPVSTAYSTKVFCRSCLNCITAELFSNAKSISASGGPKSARRATTTRRL